MAKKRTSKGSSTYQACMIRELGSKTVTRKRFQAASRKCKTGKR